MPAKITHIEKDSIAEALGLRAGDLLVSIAGEPIIDQIDYQALTAQAVFDMVVEHPGYPPRRVHVDKADWEPLGLTLDQSIVACPRECANHCVFCFIDQMPPGMRNTLYVKDDDWRLSLMMGNYITMTNISRQELDRIIRRKVSPLFISIHATDPEVRTRLLRNRHAGEIMDRLRLLRDHGIRFHCQMVLCPGLNDGEVLQKSLRELSELWPAAQSVALVPVGLTKFREGLEKVEPYTRDTARALVEGVKPAQERFLRELGTRFVFPSDEFYCLSGLPLPEDEDYEDYPQIENGVGMLRMFETDLRFAVEDYPVSRTAPRRLVIGCGTSVAGVMQGWCDKYQPEGTTVKVRPILNHFFGETVTVTGLITGGDLVEQLRDEDCDEILICRNMIRNEGDLFLDDMTLDEVRRRLPAPLRVVDNTGEAFWRAISGQEDRQA